jgi:hypothetical protein
LLLVLREVRKEAEVVHRARNIHAAGERERLPAVK